MVCKCLIKLQVASLIDFQLQLRIFDFHLFFAEDRSQLRREETRLMRATCSLPTTAVLQSCRQSCGVMDGERRSLNVKRGVQAHMSGRAGDGPRLLQAASLRNWFYIIKQFSVFILPKYTPEPSLFTRPQLYLAGLARGLCKLGAEFSWSSVEIYLKLKQL